MIRRPGLLRPRRGGAVVPLAAWDATALAAAFGVLREKLALAKRRSLAVDVCLATRFAFLDVARGDFGACTPARLRDIAEAMVEEAGLKGPEHRLVRWQLTDGGRRLFVAALEAGVLELVAQALSAAGMRAGSMQLVFAARWNAARAASRGADGVFASVEGDQVVLARLEKGEIAALDQGLVRDSAQATLDRRADRFFARLGVSPGSGRFLACGAGALSPRWQAIDPAGAQLR